MPKRFATWGRRRGLVGGDGPGSVVWLGLVRAVADPGPAADVRKARQVPPADIRDSFFDRPEERHTRPGWSSGGSAVEIRGIDGERQADVDGQAAGGIRGHGERAVVRGGHRLDDREPQSMPAVLSIAVLVAGPA